MNRSESIKNIAAALCKFNGEISHISKDANNPFFKSKYVTLDKLIDETREILQKNGLSVLQFPATQEGNGIGIQTMLLHESGEYIESDPIFMMPQKNDPQAAGSIVSYLRRYSYQAILNLNTGEDDDAESTMKREDKKISEAQAKRLYMIGKGKDNAAIKNILSKYNYSASKDILIKDYEFICKEIENL